MQATAGALFCVSVAQVSINILTRGKKSYIKIDISTKKC